MNFSNEKINTNFYSRQIFTYGMDTMNLFIKYKILIIGLRGLGFEVCKNIILAGPKNLTIFDNNTLKINDLSSNFCLEEKDVKLKKRRDESCLEYFKELNPYTNVNILDLNEDIFNSCEIKDENIFLNFDVVVVTEILHSNVINQIENVCRKNKKGFIYGLVLGLSGFVFDDFGNEFEIKDLTGEKKRKIFY
jgi:ubiquitin-activating enzyme E1